MVATRGIIKENMRNKKNSKIKKGIKNMILKRSRSSCVCERDVLGWRTWGCSPEAGDVQVLHVEADGAAFVVLVNTKVTDYGAVVGDSRARWEKIGNQGQGIVPWYNVLPALDSCSILTKNGISSNQPKRILNIFIFSQGTVYQTLANSWNIS